MCSSLIEAPNTCRYELGYLGNMYFLKKLICCLYLLKYLFLHLADISNSRLEDQIESVNKILYSLDLNKIPTVLVLNKIDRLNKIQTANLCKKLSGIPVSAPNPSTLSGLRKAMADIIF